MLLKPHENYRTTTAQRTIARARPLTVLAACALMAACASTEVDPEYQIYTDQIALNKTRFQTCTQGHIRQYSASRTATNAKVVKAAMKQCAVYAKNYCHAQVQRDNMDAGGEEMEPEVEIAAKDECLQAFTGTSQASFTAELAKTRPEPAAP